MSYELRTNVIEPQRNTFNHLVERFGDRPATRYQEASFDVQATENFHYRPTWDPDREIYDPNYTELKLTDPYSYTDPRQFYYTPYVTDAAGRYESFAQTLAYIEQRRLLDKLPETWHVVLRDYLLPLRHYESGAQLICTNACRFAYGTTIEQAASFAAFDRIGNAQQLSLVGLALASGAADTLGEAKKDWLYAEHLQGIRKILEELLVEGDWAASLIGLDIVDSLLYPLLFEHLDEQALSHGGSAYSLVARHFSDWFAGHRKWLAALVKAWVNDPKHGTDNAKALADIADRWYPQARAAVDGFAHALAESAGSVDVVHAATRGGAELVAELKKAGIAVSTDGAAQ